MDLELGIAFEDKLYKAVHDALQHVGLETIKTGPFFGIGDSQAKVVTKKAA